MIKAPQFMIKYANYQIDRALSDFPLMSEEIRSKIIKKASDPVRMFELGFIRVDDAMKTICTCFDDLTDEEKGLS